MIAAVIHAPTKSGHKIQAKTRRHMGIPVIRAMLDADTTPPHFWQEPSGVTARERGQIFLSVLCRAPAWTASRDEINLDK
jgi:hypothetical protein